MEWHWIIALDLDSSSDPSPSYSWLFSLEEEGCRRDYLPAVRTVVRPQDNKRQPCVLGASSGAFWFVTDTAQGKRLIRTATLSWRDRAVTSRAREPRNRSLPHAAQEYFRILIAHLVCCCHMAFISIPSTQWGVKGPDAMSSSILYPFLGYRQVSLSPQSSDVMFKFIVTFKCGLITLRSDLNDQSEGFILLTEWVPHP